MSRLVEPGNVAIDLDAATLLNRNLLHQVAKVRVDVGLVILVDFLHCQYPF